MSLSRITADVWGRHPSHEENFLKGFAIQRWILKNLPDAQAEEFELDEQGKAKRNLPYDIMYKGNTVDIKSSWNSHGEKQFLFTIENGGKDTHTCEYYLCVGLLDEIPIKVWYIPSKELDFHTNFTPAIRNSRPSKYDQWLVWKDEKRTANEPIGVKTSDLDPKPQSQQVPGRLNS